MLDSKGPAGKNSLQCQMNHFEWQKNNANEKSFLPDQLLDNHTSNGLVNGNDGSAIFASFVDQLKRRLTLTGVLKGLFYVYLKRVCVKGHQKLLCYEWRER